MTWFLVSPASDRAPEIRIAAVTEHDLYARIEGHLRRHRLLTSSPVTTHHPAPGRVVFTQPTERGLHKVAAAYRKD